MKYNFTLRIYKPEKRIPDLSDISNITISNITLISKPNKHTVCMHSGNKKKFGYDFDLSQPFFDWAGSHRYPVLFFKGDYIDIIVRDFPRYPVFCQETSAARSNLQGYGYTNYMNMGFPICLLYRKVEILNLNYE